MQPFFFWMELDYASLISPIDNNKKSWYIIITKGKWKVEILSWLRARLSQNWLPSTFPFENKKEANPIGGKSGTTNECSASRSKSLSTASFLFKFKLDYSSLISPIDNSRFLWYIIDAIKRDAELDWH